VRITIRKEFKPIRKAKTAWGATKPQFKVMLVIGIACMIIFPVYARVSYLTSSNNTNNNNGNNNGDPGTQGSIIDHNCAHLEDFIIIPSYWINRARTDLHVAYWHTSHGSQLVSGMNELDAFIGGTGAYLYNNGGSGGTLDLEEVSDDYSERHLSGNIDSADPPGRDFDDTTRIFLNDAANSDVNVVMWSWCSLSTDFNIIDTYLSKMNQLESEYPDVYFIYMTGHLNGGGETGAVHLANERIRDYCRNNTKFLYDFADIESYDPDDNYFLDQGADDACNYDGGNNWAEEWQAAHSTTGMTSTSDIAHSYANGGTWFHCSPSHAASAHVMGNMKAYGVWYLLAILAGWSGN